MREPDKTGPAPRPGPAPTRYYLRWQGQVSGPFDPDTIVREWQTGSISRLHQVSCDKKAWQALGTHPDLSLLLSAAAEQAAAALNPPVTDATAPPARADAVAAAWADTPADAEGRTRLKLATRAMPPVAAPPAGWATGGWPEAAAGRDGAMLNSAPWGRRLGAAMLDLAVLALVGLCGWLLLQAVGLPVAGQAPAQKLICGLILVYCGWLYSAVLESCAWQATLGKLAVGIRVETEDGGPLDFGCAAVRAFMKLWSALPAMAGVLVALRSPTRQALHDTVAKTHVVGPPAAPTGTAPSTDGVPWDAPEARAAAELPGQSGNLSRFSELFGGEERSATGARPTPAGPEPPGAGLSGALAATPTRPAANWYEHYRSYSWERLDEEYKTALLSTDPDKEARVAAIISRKADLGQQEGSLAKLFIANAEHLSQQKRMGR